MYLFDGVTQIRNFSGITDEAVVSDADIEFYIESNEADIFIKSGVKFFTNTVVDETYDGDDTDTLVLKHFPVMSITSITIGGIAKTDYYFYKDKGTIVLETGLFTEGNQNVKVSYLYGVPDFEDPIYFKSARKLCLYLATKDVLFAAGAANSQDQAGIKQEKLAEYSLTYESGGTYANRIKNLDKDIKDAYAALGITVQAKVF